MLENVRSKMPIDYDGPIYETIAKSTKESNENAINRIVSLLSGCRIGTIIKEPGEGTAVNDFNKIINLSKSEIVNATDVIKSFTVSKSELELNYIEISSKYSCFLMKALNKKFENVVNNEQRTDNKSISKSIKDVTTKDAFIKKFKERYSKEIALDKEFEDNAFNLPQDPIVQSGCEFDWSFNRPSNSNKFVQSIIVLKTISKYKSYHSSLIRTYMIDSNKTQQNNYKVLQEAFDYLLSMIKPGAVLSEIYKKTYDFVEEKSTELAKSLCDCYGYSIGYEYNSELHTISQYNNNKIENNMVFCINLTMLNLKDNKSKSYSLQIADTIIVSNNSKDSNNNNNLKVLTDDLPKKLSSILYNLEDEESENNKTSNNRKETNNNKRNSEENSQIDNYYDTDLNGKRLTRQAIAQKENRSTAVQDNTKRKNHQMELLELRNKEIKERLLNGDFGGVSEKQDKKKVESIRSYRKPEDIPSEYQKGKIFVDLKHLTVILPIFKTMIPFNGSLIKSVSKTKDGLIEYLRINFHTPLTGASNLSFSELLNSKEPVFIRDLIFKSSDKRHFESIYNNIQLMIKNVKIKEKEDKEKADLVDQENLQPNRSGKRVYIDHVSVRPLFGKKMTGTLEAHNNGFRFTPHRGDKIDIIYKNIKHAFFQPCDKDLIIIIHFHLKNPIILAKKKIHDIQFTREVGTQSDDLHMNRRGNDYDEYQNELIEQQNKDKMNREFFHFTERVQNLCSSIKFDIPYRELAFEGVPNRSSVVIIPTVNCIVNLTEMPFFVMPLDNIDMIYFERVSQGLRNFDMAVIWSDLNKPVLKITSIPLAYLELIKNWLDSVDILFAEGSRALNWNTIINQIKKDPKSFIEDGCWSALHNEADSDEEDEEEEGDPEYNLDEEEESENEEDEESEESEYADSDESEEDEELSEEGLSWDELDKRAIKSDKDKNFNDEVKVKNNKKKYK